MSLLRSLDFNTRSMIFNAQEGNRAVSLDYIAKALGITIIEISGIDGEGYLLYEEEEKAFKIYVNGKYSEASKRFIIAHEIAHFLLHKEYVLKHKQIDKGSRSGYEDYKEFEAENLASEILLPLKEIDKAIDEGNTTLSELSKVFNVSEGALKIRLHY